MKGDAVGPTLYYGAGAGAQPTASAVVADLVDVTRLITADPEHRVPHLAFQPDQLSDDADPATWSEVETSYYLRMRVLDKPGVLADITRILADSKISIDAMVQKEPGEGESQVDIVMLTQPRAGEERRPGDRAHREAADGARQGDAHPPGGAAVRLALLALALAVSLPVCAQEKRRRRRSRPRRAGSAQEGLRRSRSASSTSCRRSSRS